MVKMGGIEADETKRRLDQRLQRAALEIHHFETAAARQEEIARQMNGRFRQHHIAELEGGGDGAAVFQARADIGLEIAAVDGEVFGQRLAKLGHHVAAAIVGVVARDLLQRDHVGAAHGIGDAADIVAAVEADAVVDVVGYELHCDSGHVHKQPRPSPRLGLEQCRRF